LSRETPIKPRVVGIYLFDRVEVLDFAGPFEVFSVATRISRRLNPNDPPPFEVITISETGARVFTRGELTVTPAYSIDGHPDLDILIVPGGTVDDELSKSNVIDWMRTQAPACEITASVCTGAFLLADAGLLTGRSATTHWEDADDLEARYPALDVKRDVGWVDEGRIVTSAGISAGIDMSLHLVSRLLGPETAERTARQMEYRWSET
jgi:transcriptional regulator GlxA family with amidase domain